MFSGIMPYITSLLTGTRSYPDYQSYAYYRQAAGSGQQAPVRGRWPRNLIFLRMTSVWVMLSMLTTWAASLPGSAP